MNPKKGMRLADKRMPFFVAPRLSGSRPEMLSGRGYGASGPPADESKSSASRLTHATSLYTDDGRLACSRLHSCA